MIYTYSLGLCRHTILESKGHTKVTKGIIRYATFYPQTLLLYKKKGSKIKDFLFKIQAFIFIAPARMWFFCHLGEMHLKVKG